MMIILLFIYQLTTMIEIVWSAMERHQKQGEYTMDRRLRIIETNVPIYNEPIKAATSYLDGDGGLSGFTVELRSNSEYVN
jgi:hypothetical protein